MKKLSLPAALLFFLTCFFSTPPSVFGATGIATDKPTYTLGEPIKITINNIPWAIEDDGEIFGTSFQFSLVRNESNANTKQDIGGMDISTSPQSSDEYLCLFRPWNPDNVWTSTKCTTADNDEFSTGKPFTFVGVLDSNKLKADPDSAADIIYTITIVSGQCPNSQCVGQKEFIIKAPKPNTGDLKIGGVYNTTQRNSAYSLGATKEPAKPGDIVEIRFQPIDTDATYTWGIHGRSDNPSGKCTRLSEAAVCAVKYTIPADAAGTVAIDLFKQSTNETSSVNIKIDSLTPVPTGINTTTAPAPSPVTCAVCNREKGFFYYDQPNNRCCKYYGCPTSERLRSIINQIKQAIAAKEPTDTIVQLYVAYNEEAAKSFSPPEQKECSDGQFCSAGKGCSPQYPDPGKPPCIEGLDSEGNIVTIDDEDGFDPVTCTKTNTGVGPIETDPAGLIRSILGLLLSISGMVALYFIIRSGYQIMTSRGNPEAIQEARERLTSAIAGLLFIIFSLVILSVIGVDLLKIPGFGNS